MLALDVLSFAGIIVLFGFSRHYLSSYLSKKGENLATKEDLGQITEEVEAIRSQHATEIEKLRGDISVAASTRSSLEVAKREQLLAFLDSASELLFERLQESAGDFPIDGGRSLHEHQCSTLETFHRLFRHYHRLLAYLPPGTLVDTMASVVKHAAEARKAFRHHWGSVKLAMIAEVEHIGTDSYRDHVARSNTAAEEYANAVSPSMSEMQKAFVQYIGELRSYLLVIGSSSDAIHPMEE